ncbi:MAG: hypothetical protein DMF58_00170 [Acidobacteria bacterium]|nr:MAG: hypothetical protein DMF58_00170 [Acidobacteriota bacterium]
MRSSGFSALQHYKDASGLEGRRIKKLVRGVWKPIAGGVREVAVTSVDGGKSWQPGFDLLFRAHQK